MYALCVSGAMNMQGFVWRFLGAIYFLKIFVHSNNEYICKYTHSNNEYICKYTFSPHTHKLEHIKWINRLINDQQFNNCRSLNIKYESMPEGRQFSMQANQNADLKVKTQSS